MFYLSFIRQTKRVRQDFSVTDDAWNARRQLIRGEYRAEAARTELSELVQCWKQRLISKGGGAGAAPAAAAPVAVAEGAFAFEDE